VTAAYGSFDGFDELAEVYAKHLAPGKLDHYRQIGLLLVMGKRENIYFEHQFTGQRLINCHANGGCYNLGHCHPQVTAAVRDALGSVDIGNHHLLSAPRARLAERLSATTDHRLSRVVFGVSGGEAIDLALKVARASTRRRDVISVIGGYHGHTGLAVATGDASFRDWFGPNPKGFLQVPYDDVAALERAIDDQTAAVIVEAIPATLGMPIPSDGYFAELRRLCDERGARLVIDEVQTGLGRTGKWWGYQHDAIVPDAIVTAKGLSGGIYPIAATLFTPDMHAALDEGPNPMAHISTFGGSELGCIAASAVLDIVGAPGFLERVADLGDRIESGLRGLPLTLRRRGMFMGLALPSQEEADRAMIKLMFGGVFAFPAGNDRRVLQFLPPLILTDDQTADLIARVRGALG